MKLLFWLVLVGAVVVYAWSISKRRIDRKTPASIPPPESMAQCAHCGLHFPSSEAVVGPDASVFCSENHLRLHASS